MGKEKDKNIDEIIGALNSVKDTKKKETKDREEKQPEKDNKKETKKRKPYVHIDVYLQTAIPYFGLNNIQAAGFKSKMNGRHYQRDEEVFNKELKKYLNI